MIDSPALAELPFDRVDELHKVLLRSYDTCGYAILFLRKWLACNPGPEHRNAFTQDMVLSLIAAKRFAEAKGEIEGDAPARMSPHSLFNFLMADWGMTAKVPHELFTNFVNNIAELAEEETDANILQCFSLAYWASGDQERAMYYLDQALRHSTGASRSMFSCWAYLYRSPARSCGFGSHESYGSQNLFKN